MSTTEAVKWRHTSPLAVIFFLGKIYQQIAQNAVQSSLPLVAFLFAYEGNLMTKVILGISAFVTITIIISSVRYWFFRYQIAEDSVLIREGVIKKTELNIKFDRIQAISTTQNIVYRIFDLVTIKLDTAGSSSSKQLQCCDFKAAIQRGTAFFYMLNSIERNGRYGLPEHAGLIHDVVGTYCISLARYADQWPGE